MIQKVRLGNSQGVSLKKKLALAEIQLEFEERKEKTRQEMNLALTERQLESSPPHRVPPIYPTEQLWMRESSPQLLFI
jgi:hypothetical protein